MGAFYCLSGVTLHAKVDLITRDEDSTFSLSTSGKQAAAAATEELRFFGEGDSFANYEKEEAEKDGFVLIKSSKERIHDLCVSAETLKEKGLFPFGVNALMFGKKHAFDSKATLISLISQNAEGPLGTLARGMEYTCADKLLGGLSNLLGWVVFAGEMGANWQLSLLLSSKYALPCLEAGSQFANWMYPAVKMEGPWSFSNYATYVSKNAERWTLRNGLEGIFAQNLELPFYCASYCMVRAAHLLGNAACGYAYNASWNYAVKNYCPSGECLDVMAQEAKHALESEAQKQLSAEDTALVLAFGDQADTLRQDGDLSPAIKALFLGEECADMSEDQVKAVLDQRIETLSKLYPAASNLRTLANASIQGVFMLSQPVTHWILGQFISTEVLGACSIPFLKFVGMTADVISKGMGNTWMSSLVCTNAKGMMANNMGSLSARAVQLFMEAVKCTPAVAAALMEKASTLYQYGQNMRAYAYDAFYGKSVAPGASEGPVATPVAAKPEPKAMIGATDKAPAAPAKTEGFMSRMLKKWWK